MFSVFRRRAASTSQSDSNLKENSNIGTNNLKANAENNGFITPTLSTNGNGYKHRTLSGISLSSSSSSLTTSPLLNITRQQEKQELQTLNDRLAVIIDTVRRLEQDNEKLRVRFIDYKSIKFICILFFRVSLKQMLNHLKLKHRKLKHYMKMN
jgi:hypothetical protein